MELLDRHPKTTATVALLGLLAAIGFLVFQQVTKNQRPKGDLWFYNLKTDKLFPVSDMTLPPIDTESGPQTGVRAYVYSCGECTESEQFIAYLESMMPATKQAVEQQIKRTGAPTGIGAALEKNEGGLLVRAVEGTQWVPQLSPLGQQIMEVGRLQGGCPHPRPCIP